MFATLAGKALVPVGLAVTGFMVVCCLILYTLDIMIDVKY
jgi:hypothetical protein